MILIIGGAFQGKLEFAKNELGFSETEIFNDFHLKVKDYISKNQSLDDLINKIFQEQYKVIISDEVGLGIVPIEKFDRLWRESVGRSLCQVVKKSDEVWRVQCGIATKIKG